MKKTSIKMAILMPSLAVLIAGIIAMVAVVGVLSSNTTNALTDQLIEARVNEYSNEFRMFSQDVYGALEATTPIIANYIDPAFALDVSDPRAEVINILSKTLLSTDNIVSMWTCWEPNAFDGKDSAYAGASFYDVTGRFIPYIYRDGSSLQIEALVDYDDPVIGEFYQGALRSGKPYITEPYLYNFGGADTYIYSIAIPILKDGKVAGVVGADINLHGIIETLNSGSILSDGYFYTVSPGGLLATHPSADMLMKHYNTTWMKNYSAQVEAIIANGGHFNLNAYSDVTNTNMTFLGSGVMIGNTGRYWVICGVVPESTVNDSSNVLLWTIIYIGLTLIAFVGLTIFLIVRSRLKELPTLTAAAEAIAVGDIGSAALNAGAGATKNEIALLKRAFSKMTAGIRQQADILTQISQADYSVTAPVRSDKDVMNQAINNMLENTNGTLTQIHAAATQVSSGSKQIADGAQALAQGSTEQASAIEELSASISEIADKTKQNAEIAKEAAVLSGTIRGNAEKGSAQMEQLMQAVKEINDASSQISKVMKVIDDIAFQTNILALNAAVEAARAGQHGKGFAVVAEEVRNLAAKSADAAKDTGGLIENSIEKANFGLNMATDTSASLAEIVDGINRSAEIVTQIARSSDAQAGAIAHINTGIDQVAQVVQQNSATAEQSAAASEEMSGQSDLLEQLIAQFKLKDSQL